MDPSIVTHSLTDTPIHTRRRYWYHHCHMHAHARTHVCLVCKHVCPCVPRQAPAESVDFTIIHLTAIPLCFVLVLGGSLSGSHRVSQRILTWAGQTLCSSDGVLVRAVNIAANTLRVVTVTTAGRHRGGCPVQQQWPQTPQAATTHRSTRLTRSASLI
jgi:hypothetical protein